jgi:hypothetical protein
MRNGWPSNDDRSRLRDKLIVMVQTQVGMLGLGLGLGLELTLSLRSITV